MTIFDSGYSSVSYQPVAPLARLWPLARMEFTKIFRTKKGLLVFLACIAFQVFKAGVIWVKLGAQSQELAQGLAMLEKGSPSLSAFPFGEV